MTTLSADAIASDTSATSPTQSGRAARTGFSLTRRISLLALAAIITAGTISAVLLSRFLIAHLLQRDADVAAQFVAMETASISAELYFEATHDRERSREVETFFEHLTTIPEVLRANVYNTDRRIVWSSNREAIGRVFENNPELESALAGKIVVEAAILEHRSYVKPEHVFGETLADRFVENYLPVWNTDRSRVLGVVELYREPKDLFTAIRRGLQLIWISTLLSGAALFLALFWAVRRADRFIRAQQERLIAISTQAALGDLAAAVAHSIRSPLAAIRSSAELVREMPGHSVFEQADDVITEVDRIEVWIRDLLRYTQNTERAVDALDINAIARTEIKEVRRELERRYIAVDLDLAARLPAVAGDRAMFAQILRTLIANALDALDPGGRLTLRSEVGGDGRSVTLAIEDDGCGMSSEQLERVFVPFRSNKRHGLGVGLPLVRRTVEALGGSVAVASTIGVGTTITLTMPLE
jgi:two-component system, NtrC family, sensor histidine kinase HydH